MPSQFEAARHPQNSSSQNCQVLAADDWPDVEQGVLVRHGFKRVEARAKGDTGFANYCTDCYPAFMGEVRIMNSHTHTHTHTYTVLTVALLASKLRLKSWKRPFALLPSCKTNCKFDRLGTFGL